MSWQQRTKRDRGFALNTTKGSIILVIDAKQQRVIIGASTRDQRQQTFAVLPSVSFISAASPIFKSTTVNGGSMVGFGRSALSGVNEQQRSSARREVFIGTRLRVRSILYCAMGKASASAVVVQQAAVMEMNWSLPCG